MDGRQSHAFFEDALDLEGTSLEHRGHDTGEEEAVCRVASVGEERNRQDMSSDRQLHQLTRVVTLHAPVNIGSLPLPLSELELELFLLGPDSSSSSSSSETSIDTVSALAGADARDGPAPEEISLSILRFLFA